MADTKNNKKKKNLLYDIFNPKGNGKGLTKEEANKPKTAGMFPRYFFSNFNMMFALNLFFFLGNFPILFGLFALSGNLNIKTTAPVSSLFSSLYGAVTIDGHNPVSLALMGIHGAQTKVSLPTTATWIFFGLTALVIFTFGIVNTATAYIMRNLVKGDSITFISDIKYCIKRNFKQAFVLGIIDLIFLALIVYDILFFYTMAANSMGSFLFGMMLIIGMMYMMMRPYMYIMIVTFDLKLTKILKNAFIFTLIGFKRNIAAFLGCVAVWAFDYLIMTIIFPIGILLPVLFLISLTTFMGIYAAYPKIKEIMIDPYYVSDDVGARAKDDLSYQEELIEEPIFKDRG